MTQINVYSQPESPNTGKGWLRTSGIWFSKTFNNFDTVYVKNTPSKYTLILRNSNWLNFYNFDMDNKNKIVMQSELYYNAGFILGYKFLLLGYSVNLNETFSGEKVKSQELDLHVNCSCLSIDVYYTDNQGATSITEFKGIKNIKNKSISFDGLTMKTLDGDINYYFNNKEYANSAAYSRGYFKKQKKSAGSFIAGLSYARHRIYFDFTDLPEDTVFSSLKVLDDKSILYNSYCLNIGYGYNLVFSKKWLANLTIIPSAGINSYKKKMSEDIPNNIFSMNTKVKAALVYNMSDYFLGFSALFSSNWFFADNYTLVNSFGNFNISYGMRF